MDENDKNPKTEGASPKNVITTLHIPRDMLIDENKLEQRDKRRDALKSAMVVVKSLLVISWILVIITILNLLDSGPKEYAFVQMVHPDAPPVDRSAFASTLFNLSIWVLMANGPINFFAALLQSKLDKKFTKTAKNYALLGALSLVAGLALYFLW